MGIILLPQRFKPPNGKLEVNWGHPITRGLVWVAYPSAAHPYEIISGRPGVLFAGSNWNGASAYGGGLASTSSTTGGAYFPDSGEQLRAITRDFSVLFMGRWTTLPTTAGFFSVPMDATTTTLYPLRFNSTSTARGNSVFATNSTTQNNENSSLFGFSTNGRPYLAGATRASGVTDFFRAGRFQETSATPTSNVFWPATIEPPVLLNNNAGVSPGTSPQGVLVWAAVWNRALSRSEVALLDSQPMILLRPEPILLRVAGGGGGTILELSGTSAGTSTTSGSLSQSSTLSGNSAGDSTDSGTATELQALSGATAGDSTTSGNLAQIVALTGTSAGNSTDSGALSSTQTLSGSSDGSSSDSGELDSGNILELSGTSAGGSTDSGSISQSSSLAGTSAGASTDTGNLSQEATLSGSSSGGSTDSGELSTGTILELSGTSEGSSTDTGSLGLVLGLAGTSAGDSTDSGTLGLIELLQGVSAGDSETIGAIAVLEQLTGLTAGGSTDSGTLSGTAPIAKVNQLVIVPIERITDLEIEPIERITQVTILPP